MSQHREIPAVVRHLDRALTWITAGCVAAGLSGCGGVVPLPKSAAASLRDPPGSYGELVYTGAVVPRGGTTPVFRYERRVEERPDDLQRSTHVTLSTEGEVVLLQQATHTRDYELVRFDETSAQRGTVTTITVGADRSLTFRQEGAAKVVRKVEGGGDGGAPVVVGPTLFGFVRAHLAQLRAGNDVDVRFAVPEECRTYSFVLAMSTHDRGVTTITLTPSQVLLRLVISPMRIVIDDRTGNFTSYHGRVPPLLHGSSFDANVQYTYNGSAYR